MCKKFLFPQQSMFKRVTKQLEIMSAVWRFLPKFSQNKGNISNFHTFSFSVEPKTYMNSLHKRFKGGEILFLRFKTDTKHFGAEIKSCKSNKDLNDI